MKRMTAMELNAEIYRGLGELATSEDYLKRVARYIKKLVAEKQADPTLMMKEEFFARVDKAEQQIDRGEGITFDNQEAMKAWLNSL